jgi:hypothetical protein
MATTSATGGTLLPAAPPPADDDALDKVFQSLVTSITGLDGSLVRPRWQTVVPKQPPPSTNWCAISVMTSDPIDGPFVQYDPVTGGELYSIHEEIHVLSGFYGPLANQFAKQLRDGLRVPQNTEVLLANQIRFVSSGPIRSVPSFVNEQWIRRQDMSLRFRRKVVRTYAVETLQVAVVHLFDDTVINDTIVVPPGSPVEP